MELADAAQYSPSPAGYVNTVLLVLIGVIVSLIGYWVHRQDSRVDVLEATVNTIKTTVAVLDSVMGAVKEVVSRLEQTPRT